MGDTIADTMFDKESDKESDSEEMTTKVDTTELDSVFTCPYHLEGEEAVSMKKNYILYMDVKKNTSNLRLGIALSDCTCKVYDVHSNFKAVTSIPAHDSPVVSVRFAPDNENLIYTGSQNEFIRLWDLRQSGDCVKHFKDTSSEAGSEKPLLSFDISCDGRFLSGGTELSEDAFLLFWDVRSTDLLGGYWESHTDDITQVMFHPSETSKMVSGSTDGLVNVYDISQPTEEDALLFSLNTESSVEKINWHERERQQWYLSCITHTYDIKIWNQDEAIPYEFSREKLAPSAHVDADSLYVAGIHSLKDSNELLFLVGSNERKGDCLRSVKMDQKKLKPVTQFTGNKQIVRCSWYDPSSELLLTAGESGILSLWKPGQEHTEMQQNELKMTSKTKPHKIKPY